VYAGEGGFCVLAGGVSDFRRCPCFAYSEFWGYALDSLGGKKMGTRAAKASQLLPLAYEQLRRQAELDLQKEPNGHTLSATALVHEAYLRLIPAKNEAYFENQGHFYAVLRQAMQRVLIDHARMKNAQKRGGKRH